MSSEPADIPWLDETDPRAVARTLPLDWFTRTRLWVLLVFVSVGDLLTTVYGLHIGATEANPLAAAAIGVLGWPVLIPLKLGCLGLCWCCFQVTPARYVRSMLSAITLYFGAIVLVNSMVLGQLHGLW